MVIIHFLDREESKCNGVSVVVPQHVREQAKFEDVALINIKGAFNNKEIKQFDYVKKAPISGLPHPFNHPDLVIFHEVYCLKYIKISFYLKRKKIPYIIMPHGCLNKAAQRNKSKKKAIANLLLFNRFIKNARAIQCLSEYERDNTTGNANKIIATNGVYLPEVTNKPLCDGKIRFVYIGRLDIYHKGIDLLIKAISLKKDIIERNNCSFSLYGPDKDDSHKKINTMIKQFGLEKCVNVYKEVTSEEKEKVLLNADIFVQTSRFEGMPMGLLEAMSYGIPVLITKGTTLDKYVYAYTAGWVSENDAQSISNGIERAISEIASKNQKATQARAIISDNYTWGKVIPQTIELYKKIVNP